MKKFFLIIPAVAFAATVAHGQTTYQKTYGGTTDDKGFDIQQTSDGGFVITGTTYSFSGNWDIYLIKTDTAGNSLWTKTFGGTSWEQGYSVQQTSDGGYIIAGTTTSFGAGYYDIYLIKTDGNGNPLWSKTYGGTANDKGYSVQQTTDGGYVIAGYTTSFGSGYAHVYMIKTDVSGNSLWTKTLHGSNAIWSSGYAVRETTDGGYVVLGDISNLSTGSLDIYLVKTDGNGNSLWSKSYGGTDSENGTSIQQITDGGYIISGSTSSYGAGSYDIYLIKTDGSGNPLWSKTYGGTANDKGYSVQQTTDGGYVIAGSTSSFAASNGDVYLIKTDINGDSLWTKNFGGIISSDEGNSVQQTADGGYVITGCTNSYWSGNSTDVYLVKTDVYGNNVCNGLNPPTVVTAPTTIAANLITQQVLSGGTVGNPSTQTTGSAGMISSACSTVGINNLQNAEVVLHVSPNPFSTQTTIQTGVPLIKATLTVDNCFGQTVKQMKNISGQTVTFSRNNLPAGLYFLRIEEGDTVYTGKLIITDK